MEPFMTSTGPLANAAAQVSAGTPAPAPATESAVNSVADALADLGDLSCELVSLQSLALKAGHDYCRCIVRANKAQRRDLADFFHRRLKDLIEYIRKDSVRAEEFATLLLEGDFEGGPGPSTVADPRRGGGQH